MSHVKMEMIDDGLNRRERSEVKSENSESFTLKQLEPCVQRKLCRNVTSGEKSRGSQTGRESSERDVI